MKEALITDIWTVLVEHLSERQRKNAAVEYVNVLQDHGIKETMLESLVGVDPYLDFALEAVMDDEDDDYDDE
jgi:hypothetical protein